MRPLADKDGALLPLLVVFCLGCANVATFQELQSGAVASTPFPSMRPSLHHTAKDQGLRVRELERIVIPSYSATNAPIESVLSELVRLSETHAPGRDGCSITMQLATQEAREWDADDPWGDRRRESEHAEIAPITIEVDNASFLTIVDLICAQAGLVWRLETIIVISSEEEYERSRDLMKERIEQDGGGANKPSERTR